MSHAKQFNLRAQFKKNWWIFFYFGFWKPDKQNILYNFYTFSCFCVLITFLLPQAIYMVVNGDNIQEITSTLFVFCTFFVNLVKTATVYCNMDALKQILNNFGENPLLQAKCHEHVTEAQKIKNHGDYLFFFGSFLGFGTQIFWTLYPLIQEKKMLPVNGWYPYNQMEPHYFKLTWLFQNFASAFNIIHTMNIDSFTINLMMQIGLQCDFLRLTLEDIDKFKTTKGVLVYRPVNGRIKVKDFQRNMIENLTICIEHHVEIIRISKTIENIYRTSLAVLFMGGALIYCAILYQISHNTLTPMEFIYLLFFLFSMLTEQFIFCWFGNQITFKSESISKAICKLPWTDCTVQFRKMLLMFMLSLNKPISLHAGRIIPLSIQVFLHVLKTSYSCLALLNSL